MLIVDDAHGAQEAQSDAMRENTLEWLDMAWSTRKNDPRSSCEIMIMQRLHDMDAAGHMLKQGGWEHLCLPAEYDGVKRKTKLGYYDPRTEMGELLWPNRFGRTELDALKKALGSAYAISGQLQQQPSPEGGGILKTEHVQLWPAHKTLPPYEKLGLRNPKLKGYEEGYPITDATVAGSMQALWDFHRLPLPERTAKFDEYYDRTNMVDWYLLISFTAAAHLS